MLKLQPLSNKILVEPISETVKSAVVHSDSERDDKKLRPIKGRVLACGREYKGELKRGDTVWFSKYECEWIEIGGKEFVIGIPDYFFIVQR